MARTAKKTNVNVSLQEAQEAAHLFADISLKKEKQTNEMNEKIKAIMAQYEPSITKLEEQLVDPYDVLETFGKENKESWKNKSYELAACVIGFRTCPASVDKKKGITWEAVVGLLKGKKALKQFVKTKEDVDKTAILGSQTDLKVMKALEGIGVTIKKDEKFFVEDKHEKAVAA